MWCILLSFGLQLLPCCTMHAFFVHVGIYMLFASYSSSCWPCFSMLVSWALDPGLFVFRMALHVVLHWWGFRSVWLISVRRHAFSVIVPWNGLWCLYSWRGWLSLYGGIGRKLLPSHVIASMNPYILRHLSHLHMHNHGRYDFTIHARLLCIALATLALWPCVAPALPILERVSHGQGLLCSVLCCPSLPQRSCLFFGLPAPLLSLNAAFLQTTKSVVSN